MWTFAVFYGIKTSNRPQCFAIVAQYTNEFYYLAWTVVCTFPKSGQPHWLIKTVNKTVKVFGICFSSTSFFFFFCFFAHSIMLSHCFACFVWSFKLLQNTYIHWRWILESSQVLRVISLPYIFSSHIQIETLVGLYYFVCVEGKVRVVREQSSMVWFMMTTITTEAKLMWKEKIWTLRWRNFQQNKILC